MDHCHLGDFQSRQIDEKALKSAKNIAYLSIHLMTSLRDPLLDLHLKIGAYEIASHSTFWKRPKLSSRLSTSSAQTWAILPNLS